MSDSKTSISLRKLLLLSFNRKLSFNELSDLLYMYVQIKCPSFELELSPFVRTQFHYDILSITWHYIVHNMTLYCPDKGQNIIDKTKFHDNIIMKYCPGGHNFTGHNFALQYDLGLIKGMIWKMPCNNLYLSARLGHSCKTKVK